MRVIHVLRKPLSTSTLAQSLVRLGTGALHIDACRIQVDPGDDSPDDYWPPHPLGRWPANLVLEDDGGEVKDRIFKRVGG